jgi:hypothetical protein
MVLFALMMLWSIAWAGGAPPTAGAGDDEARQESRPVTLRSVEQAADVEDPRALIRAGKHWLANGDPELARSLFELAVERSELLRYTTLRSYIREALVLERMGEVEAARTAWRRGFSDDVQTTLVALRIASEHPDRQALFDEGIAHVRGLVEAAKRGDPAVFYTTTTGAPRHLEVLDLDAVLAQLRAGDGGFRYCYIENLDLTDFPSEQLPPSITFNRCVIGSIKIPDKDVPDLTIRAIVLGDTDLGKTWEGEVNKSKAVPGSRFGSLMIRDSVLLGRAGFQEITVSGRIAYFVLSSFEKLADFRDTTFEGLTDFRFSIFGGGANFKEAHLSEDVYFGHTRYLDDTTFRGMFSANDVFFDSTRFEKAAHFDRCEWARDITFENSHFQGPVTFHSSSVGGRLNLSRSVVEDTLEVKEMHVGGMDLIGAWLRGDTSFIDVRFDGKVRFSLDDITRAQHLSDPTPLLPLYRDYQGDKDAEEPLTRKSSYGVEHIDDLIARVDGNLSFANSVFWGFLIFERVQFGLPGADTTAEFYNTQFKGESHFERTRFHSVADFTTIFGNELSFYEAEFQRSLIFDDANVSGRVTLTDATFADGADLSFYGAEIASFQVDRDQITEGGESRLFYQSCAEGAPIPPTDVRIARLRREHSISEASIREACHDRLIDEYVSLKSSFGDRAMTSDEDWAYWWVKHTELMMAVRHGSWWDRAWSALFIWPLFELSFGWGVRLGNLGISLAFWTVFFAWVYRRFCPDTVVVYDGRDVPIREVPFHGLIYISLQSLGAFNTGWDFGEDDARFQYLNTVETFVGIIILTFFVGAYTRMILA